MVYAMKKVLIYTDGSSRGNPGPGGYGTVLLSGGHQKELSGGYLIGLEALNQGCEVEVYSDSKYVINAMNLGWIESWKVLGWAKKGKKPLKNADLWRRLDAARSMHSVTWVWVKGHAGNHYNEICDRLATDAAQSPEQSEDVGFIEIEEEDLFG